MGYNWVHRLQTAHPASAAQANEANEPAYTSDNHNSRPTKAREGIVIAQTKTNGRADRQTDNTNTETQTDEQTDGHKQPTLHKKHVRPLWTTLIPKIAGIPL